MNKKYNFKKSELLKNLKLDKKYNQKNRPKKSTTIITTKNGSTNKNQNYKKYTKNRTKKIRTIK